MTQHVVKQAQDQDIDILDALTGPLGFQKEDGYFARCLGEQAAGKRIVLMGVIDKTPAGYAMLNWQPRYGGYQKNGIPEIQDINVVPAHRRKGLARKMIEHCEQLARERGHEYIGISVGLHPGYGAAQRLYVKMGYIPDGHGVTYDRAPVSEYEFRPVDDYLCLMLLKALK